MLNQLQTKLAVVEQVLKWAKYFWFHYANFYLIYLQELKDKDLLLAKQQELLTASQEQKV